ncbi:aminotransferase class I/II-fold pyridoxal phosphate-dependent enzyme [Streptomyces sp. LE64]|uniref:aminotransferase class I/II-fold pyridoxal phosphate-dependent enzyme n=1 Tax=Streptomyces sp. LE64 TaxID=3448653 RepID=UPI004041D239
MTPQAPVLDALADYHASGQTPFTPPGHKQGRGADPRVRRVLGEAVFASDVLAVAGLDDRRSTHRVLARAEELMADAVGAEHTFFATAGSSLSVKSAILAVARPHEKLVLGRDAHKSVVAGLVLAGIEPVWVDPNWDSARHLAHPPGPEAFAAAFEHAPDARGALVTSPTPYGTCADLAGIAEVCHDRDVPLIVDEAWGAHLPFHDGLPTWAMDAGADICVTSVHKMGSGLEQGSVFHLQHDRVDPRVLKSREDLLGTTSPSVLLYAALDGWRRQMVQQGTDLYDKALELAVRTKERIARIDGFHVETRDDFCGPRLAADLDPLQITIDLTPLGITGYQAADWIREHHRVNLHIADHRRITAQLTHADTPATTGALTAALTELAGHAEHLSHGPSMTVPNPGELRLEQTMLPRDAFFGPIEDTPWDQAAGRVAAEMLTPYPPGIPTVLPGERLNRAVLDYLHSGVAAGMVVPDAADAGLDTVRVVALP